MTTVHFTPVITIHVFFQLSEAVDDVKKNNKVRSVIICSLVPGIFCAGNDASHLIESNLLLFVKINEQTAYTL